MTNTDHLALGNPAFDPLTLAALHQELLSWYANHGRDLPWRHTRDPYAILVSEVMLQQTQVERVVGKYLTFLAAFPTFATLAAASPEEVIRAWAPLGYNQRAIRLRRIAQTIIQERAGQVPTTIADLLTLPGVGRYTAGAVACFALSQAVAMVDINIQRVLTRILVGDFNAEAPAYKSPARALALAEAALPTSPSAAYAWNQALMDLGATICNARQPHCERCPVAAHCATYAHIASQTLFPSGQAWQQLARVAEASAPYHTRPRVPFKGSTRYARGRILAALRAVAPGTALALSAIGPTVKADFTDTDLDWLRDLAQGLVRDGLAEWASATSADRPMLSDHLRLPKA